MKQPCAVVVAIPTAEEAPNQAINSRTFAAALLDWVGDELPTPTAVEKSPLLSWGYGHIKMIGENGGSILGRRTQVQGREGAPMGVSHRSGGTVGLYREGRMVRAATAEEARDLPIIGTWGFRYIVAVAERAFVDGKPIIR